MIDSKKFERDAGGNRAHFLIPPDLFQFGNNSSHPCGIDSEWFDEKLPCHERDERKQECFPRNIPLLLFEQFQERLTVFRAELRQIKELDHCFTEAVIQIIEAVGLDRPDPGVSLSTA